MSVMCYGVPMTTNLELHTTTTVATTAPTASELLAGWLLSHRSENTRQAYRRDLRQWLLFCDDNGLDPLAVTRAQVDGWARTLELAYRPTTVARRLAAVSSWYRYLVGCGVLSAAPTEYVTRPRTSEGYVELTPALDADELAALLAAAESPRDRALVLVLVVLGLRVSEALALNLDGLESVRGHTTVLVAGKGGRVDRLPLPPMLVAALDDIAAAESRTTGPVWANSDGTRWNRHQVGRALARLGRRAGLARPLRPHMLRATCITRALDLGATLRDVQDLARHADPRTTRRYDRARGALDRSPAYLVAGDIAGVVA
jgi:integrase/recombinase XerD